MIVLRYVYADGFSNLVNLVELFGRGKTLVESFARMHGGIVRVEVPAEKTGEGEQASAAGGPPGRSFQDTQDLRTVEYVEKFS